MLYLLKICGVIFERDLTASTKHPVTSTPPEELPHTGAGNARGMGVAGLLLLASGALMVTVVRRRRRLERP